jgi:hypothetical protein
MSLFFHIPPLWFASFLAWARAPFLGRATSRQTEDGRCAEGPPTASLQGGPPNPGAEIGGLLASRLLHWLRSFRGGLPDRAGDSARETNSFSQRFMVAVAPQGPVHHRPNPELPALRPPALRNPLERHQAFPDQVLDCLRGRRPLLVCCAQCAWPHGPLGGPGTVNMPEYSTLCPNYHVIPGLLRSLLPALRKFRPYVLKPHRSRVPGIEGPVLRADVPGGPPGVRFRLAHRWPYDRVHVSV